jgi:hypothetical protein
MNNWNTQKIHEILHFPEQIREFGHLMNADTGVGERGLKYWETSPFREEGFYSCIYGINYKSGG